MVHPPEDLPLVDRSVQLCHGLISGAWIQEHPVNEALFNLVNVWSLMLWPLMLADKKGAKVKNKFGWYLGTQVML